MIRFNLFKRVSHQTFKYIPRFYDPEKEALKERLERYKGLEGDGQNIQNSKDRIRSGLRSRYGTSSDAGYRSKLVRKSNIRLVIIVGILVMLCIMVLQSNKLDGLLSLLLK